MASRSISAPPPWLAAPRRLRLLLASPAVRFVARLALTAPFWWSGFAKILDFPEGVAEMASAGLAPPSLFNVATFVCQLVGSALVISGRGVWLGCALLGGFTVVVSLLVHRFWLVPEPQAGVVLMTFLEHMSIAAGFLILAAAHLDREREVP